MKPRGRDHKKGLRVAYHDHVERLSAGGHRVLETTLNGWFVEVRRSGKWFVLMDLRFAREKDALRAAQSLTIPVAAPDLP